MSSSIIIFPNVTKLINVNGNYIRPTIDTNDSSFFILNDINSKYLLTNTDIANKDINIEVFAVGGGGAGGYFNGNGGDGGMVIYKSLQIKSNDVLELSIGKGAFYVKDNQPIKGFLLKIYEGSINDFFNIQNRYLMDMKPADLITKGITKKIEKKVSKIATLKILTEDDVDLTLITNPIYSEECEKNPTGENCGTVVKNWYAYNGYTIEIYSNFQVPYDCSLEIEITAFKYAILFFYSDNDINNNRFSKDLINYKNYSNDYWMEVQDETKIFRKNNLKEGEKYNFKIIHTQDKQLTLNENNFKINMKIIKKIDNSPLLLVDDSFFNYNNGTENFGVFYSTPTTIYNTQSKTFLINAIGGITGFTNPETSGSGKGGCALYEINNKKTKVCKEDGNGANGLKLPSSFSSVLQELPLSNYRFGSGGGGAYWLLNGYGGQGGTNAGNGISFTNVPSLSRPTETTGGGGGGNSFLTNISERNLAINKLSGANGILILKINKTKEQILVQTFANMSDLIETKKPDENDFIRIMNDKIGLLYKTDKPNIYDKAKFYEIIGTGGLTVRINNITYDITDFNFIIIRLYIFFSILITKFGNYLKLGEKERLKYPIKFVYDRTRLIEDFYLENKFYNFNFANYSEVNFYFTHLPTNTDTILNEIFDIYTNKPTVDNNNYSVIYIRKVLAEITDPSRVILLIENSYKNYFYYLISIANSAYYSILKTYFDTGISIITDINNITTIIKNFNNNFFNPTDKNSNKATDTKVTERSSYIEQQKIFKEIYQENKNKLEKSNMITNFSINKFKAKYELNNKNNWFNIIFIITIIIIVLIFLFSYNFFERQVRPLIILILTIIIIILIISLWMKSSYELSIYENFACSDSSEATIPCLTIGGTVLTKTRTDNSTPYYYLSRSINNQPLVLKPKNDLLVDIFVYGTPVMVRDGGNYKYYLPNIDVYTNVLFTNTSTYNIYNDKIDKITIDKLDGSQDIITIVGRPLRETEEKSIIIYDCQNKDNDICFTNGIKQKTTLNSTRFSNYNANNIYIPPSGTTPIAQDQNNKIQEIYDFNPLQKSSLYKYSSLFLSFGVTNEEFIVIKVKNDTTTTSGTISGAVDNFKNEMKLLEMNVNLFILNKNTKKIVDFTSNYEKKNQKDFQRTFEKNSTIYDKHQMAYHILNREIMINFYIKLLICILILIFLLCAILYHYMRRDLTTIFIIGIILAIVAIGIIFLLIYRHQRINTNKFYFPKELEVGDLRKKSNNN